MALRCKIYRTIEELQIDLDEGLAYYNVERRPMQTFIDGRKEWHDKTATLNS